MSMSVPASDNRLSGLRIILEQPIQLSAQSGHGDFACPTEFAQIPDFDLCFLSYRFPKTHRICKSNKVSLLKAYERAVLGCKRMGASLHRTCYCGISLQQSVLGLCLAERGTRRAECGEILCAQLDTACRADEVGFASLSPRANKAMPLGSHRPLLAKSDAPRMPKLERHSAVHWYPPRATNLGFQMKKRKQVKSGKTRPARPTPDCHNAVLGVKDNCNTASSNATSECPSQYQKKKKKKRSEFHHEFDPSCGIQSRWGDRRDHRTVRFWDWTHLIAISSFITMLPATGVQRLDTITSTRNGPLNGSNASEIQNGLRGGSHAAAMSDPRMRL